MSVIVGKAAVSLAPGTPLQIKDVTFDPPSDGEVRVKIIATALCHSDLNIIQGVFTDASCLDEVNGRPIISGHEAAGIVESVGKNVTSVIPGDHVIPLWITQCNQCNLCLKKPKSNACRKHVSAELSLFRYDGTSRIHFVSDGQPVLTHLGVGSFSEYIILPEENVCRISKEIPLEHAAILGCALGTGYGSARNIAQVNPGSVCAIWGIGAVGLSALIGCKASGASRIVVIDTNPDKFALAMNLGATECVNPNQTGKDTVQLIRGEDGIDYAFECTGVPACLEQATKTLAQWGTLVIVGLQPRGSLLTIPTLELVEGQTITGGWYGRYKPIDGIQTLASEYLKGDLPVDKLITHKISLQEINEGIEMLTHGKSIRTVITF